MSTHPPLLPTPPPLPLIPLKQLAAAPALLARRKHTGARCCPSSPALALSQVRAPRIASQRAPASHIIAIASCRNLSHCFASHRITSHRRPCRPSAPRISRPRRPTTAPSRRRQHRSSSIHRSAIASVRRRYACSPRSNSSTSSPAAFPPQQQRQRQHQHQQQHPHQHQQPTSTSISTSNNTSTNIGTSNTPAPASAPAKPLAPTLH